MSGISRRDLLNLGIGGVAGAGAGWFAARRTSPAPDEPALAKLQLQTVTAASNVQVMFVIRGGYGLVRRKRVADPSKQDLVVVSPKAGSQPCDQMDHKLVAVVAKGRGELDAASTVPVNSNASFYWAELNGLCMFTSGMGNDGVTWPTQSAPTGPESVPDPFDQELNWDNLGWIHTLGPAPADLNARISRSLLITAGQLIVLPPLNPFGLLGRWHFKKPDGTTATRKALTDKIQLTYQTDSPTVVIRQADGKELIMKPEGGQLRVHFQNERILGNRCFKPGDSLEHFDALYSLVGDAPCAERQLPVFEHVPNRTYPSCMGLTPGDLCPPGFLEQ